MDLLQYLDHTKTQSMQHLSVFSLENEIHLNMLLTAYTPTRMYTMHPRLLVQMEPKQSKQ